MVLHHFSINTNGFEYKIVRIIMKKLLLVDMISISHDNIGEYSVTYNTNTTICSVLSPLLKKP